MTGKTHNASGKSTINLVAHGRGSNPENISSKDSTTEDATGTKYQANRNNKTRFMVAIIRTNIGFIKLAINV